jgi:hypothetical protein
MRRRTAKMITDPMSIAQMQITARHRTCDPQILMRLISLNAAQ